MAKISSPVGVQRVQRERGAFLWDLSGECWRSDVMRSEWGWTRQSHERTPDTFTSENP
jgi:hypothetical protein